MKLSAEFPVVNADDVDLSVTSAAAQATPPNLRLFVTYS
jgi:hypothetical protein